MKRIYIALKYTGQEDESFAIANKVIGYVIQMGYIPISPISMTHTAAKNFGLPPDSDFWWELNKTLLDACDEIWVCSTDSLDYKESKGVAMEIEYARKNGMEVKFLNMNLMFFYYEQ
jgi:hypothetical protein